MPIRELPHYTSKRPHYRTIDARAMAALYNEGSTIPALIAVDTETCYDPELRAPEAISKWINGGRNNRPFGASFYWEDDAGPHGYWVTGDLRNLRPMLADTGITKIFHNSQYDVLMLGNLGIDVADPIMDTMCMIKLIDEEFECKLPGPDGKPKRDEHGKLVLKKSAALKNLAYHFLGEDAHELEDLVDECRAIIAANTGRSKSEVGYAEAPAEIMKDYAIADTEYTYRLFKLFKPMMDEQALWPPYQDGINAMRAVVDMERLGIRVDQELMAEDEVRLRRTQAAAEGVVLSLLGKQVNLNSNGELVPALIDRGVAWRWYTENGDYQLDKAVIKAIAEEYPDLKMMLAALSSYRKTSKLLSTYIDGIRDYIQEDGKVHASFYLWPDDWDKGSAKTGRMSASNPNLQNQVKKAVHLSTDDEDGVQEFDIKVRRYFIPDENCIFAFFDGDAQEFRVLGHYSNDPAFMQIIKDGKDVHTGTAAMLFQVPYEEVTDDQRASGKSCNFAKVYSQGTLAFANSMRRARGLPPLDEARVRKGTKFLYAKQPAFKYPPYSCRRCDYGDCAACKAGIIALAPDDEIRDGIEYFLSDEVQEWMKIAKAEDERYFAQFPGIKAFTKEVADVAAKRGYVRYWNGRRRHFKKPKEEAYKAGNSLIQGG